MNITYFYIARMCEQKTFQQVITKYLMLYIAFWQEFNLNPINVYLLLILEIFDPSQPNLFSIYLPYPKYDLGKHNTLEHFDFIRVSRIKVLMAVWYSWNINLEFNVL